MEDKPESLENIAEKEVKKGFFRRNLKKIGLAAGSAVLLTALAGSHLFFKRQGQVIKGTLDGKIDSEKYQSMFLDMDYIKDISQVEDLLAEVYHLNTGKKIEDLYRFNIFKKDEFLRIKISEFLGGKPIGMSWGNGDLYVKKNCIADFLKVAFHELGHENKDSYISQTKRALRYLTDYITGTPRNTEPIAEKNVIDSMISLMYLDPDLGYSVYIDTLGKDMNHNSLFSCKKSKWRDAEKINMLNLVKKGKIKIKKEYASEKEVEEIIKKNIEEKKANNLISDIYSGILHSFKKRFQDRKDFQEKYDKLKNYFEYGDSDSLYSKTFIGKEKVQEKLKKKLEFYEKDHPELIKVNLEDSITSDHLFLKDFEGDYNFKKKIIKKKADNKKWDKINMFKTSSCLDYAIKENKKEDISLLFDILKKAEKKQRCNFIKSKIETYEAYLE
ncbi:hypothetical protein GF336_07455 [Candidatus Woesearchaeota archaeon]|nr:hypothetical protein [Candidatus Woesearchaeota archaeon]